MAELNDLRQKICDLVDFWFGDINYARDSYLRGLENEKGWVPIPALLSFNRLEEQNVTHSQLASSVLRSRIVELDMDGLAIRKRRDQGPSFSFFSITPAIPLATRSPHAPPPPVEVPQHNISPVLRPATPPLAAALLTELDSPVDLLIAKQIDFYFSDTNWSKDTFLRQLANSKGWIGIEDILAFQRMKKFGPPTVLQLSRAVHLMSMNAEVDSTESYIRKRMDGAAGSSSQDSPGGVVPMRRSLPTARIYSPRPINAQLSSIAAAAAAASPEIATLLASVVGNNNSSPPQALDAGALLEAPKQAPAEEEGEEQPAPRADFDPLPIRPAALLDGVRQMVSLPSSSAAAAADESASFTVMTYNILAPHLTSSQFFPYADERCLEWEYRREAIFSEIEHYGPSLVALQEVSSLGPMDNAHPDNVVRWVMDRMRTMGYEGQYCPKTAAPPPPRKAHVSRRPAAAAAGASAPAPSRPRSKSPVQSQEIANIGNGVFWRTDEWTLVESTNISLHNLLLRAASRQDTALAQFIQSKGYSYGQVAVFCLLESKKTPGRHVMMASVHLSADWRRGFIALSQSALMMRALEAHTAAIELKIGYKPAIVLCGDFNSVPTSSTYELVTRGSVSLEKPDGEPIDEIKSLVQCGYTKMAVPQPYHNLKHFASSYATVLGAEPFATNYPEQFQGTLDYIFYDQTDLQAEAVLNIPSEDVLQSQQFIPSSIFPSDHISLMTRFRFL